jgi:hypothetical protein
MEKLMGSRSSWSSGVQEFRRMMRVTILQERNAFWAPEYE